MTLDKFLDVLLNQRLYFSRAEALTDKYEAVAPKANVKRLLNRQSNADSVSDPWEYLTKMLNLRKRTVVSSWSIGPGESYALWKIYLQGGRSGVAIRTTVSRLERAIKDHRLGRDIRIRQVRYGAIFEQDDPGWDEIVTRKAQHYEYEREVRCYFILDPEPPAEQPINSEGVDRGGLPPPPTPVSVKPRPGVYVSADLDELIQEIYVSPFAGEWYERLLKDLLERLAPMLRDRIRSSEVRDE